MALVGTVVFLRLNDHDTAFSNDEAHDLVLDVASGAHDLGVIARRLLVKPTDAPLCAS